MSLFGVCLFLLAMVHVRAQVAVCSCSAWHLKLPPDTAFAAAHPSIQKHFDQWWRQRLQQVVKEIHQRRDAAFNASKSATRGIQKQVAKNTGKCTPIVGAFVPH